MKKQKVCIVSFLPVELLPPLYNLIRDDRWCDYHLTVYTRHPSTQEEEPIPVNGAIFKRAGVMRRHSCSIFNLWKRLLFACRALIYLIYSRPAAVLYINPESVVPVYYYRRYFRKHVRLFAHYYEYDEPGAHDNRPFYRYVSRLGKYMFGKLEWQSQCNEKRLELFCRDTGISPGIARVVHNYPPKLWKSFYIDRKEPARPVRIIYNGLGLSFAGMYVREFAEYIKSLNGLVQWDVYCMNIKPDIAEFFEQLDTPYVRLIHSPCRYDELPVRMRNYDVGVLLYKDITDNHKYAESNKFYEYLVCGLDVWFPRSMVLQHAFINPGFYPRVVMLDFEHLNGTDVETLASHRGCSRMSFDFTSENAADDFFRQLADRNEGSQI